MAENKYISTRQLVLMAMMVAAHVVLSRFLSISLWNLKIGFAFVPVVLTAMLLGPVAAGVVAALGDVVGATLFPIGPYFPGFSFTALLVGICYGLFLYKKPDGKTYAPFHGKKGIFPAVILTELGGTVLLNSLWISMLYGVPFLTLLPARTLQALGMGIVEILVIRVLLNYMPHLQKAV